MHPTFNLRELIFDNWGTSLMGSLSILLGLLGNLTADDIQSYIDWFNNVMDQPNKTMRIGLILMGIGGLLSKDPRTPSSPNSSGGSEPPNARTREASEVSATLGSPVI